jgi:hypothetical protein
MWARWLVSLVVLAGCEEEGLVLPGQCKTEPVCNCGEVDSPADEGATHVPEGTVVQYKANPPATGSHWPAWDMTWGNYVNPPLPPMRWLHNLEHGGVVLLYNCPSGCASEVAALTAIKNGLRPDKFNAIRVIITPYPGMPRKFAAVAWKWRWLGDSVDENAIKCFIATRYDRAPESTP